MKKLILIFGLFYLYFSIHAQEFDAPYTAKALWNEMNKPEYRFLKEKQSKGSVLSDGERQWIGQYEEYLEKYYKSLSAEEKQVYLDNKANWYTEAGYAEQYNFAADSRIEQEDGSQLSTNTKPIRDPNLLIKHMAYSGIYGAYYGLMINEIFDIEDEALRTGIPFISAGGSILVPIISSQYNYINNNSLWLKSHGKSIGLLDGFMIGAAVFGNDAFDDGDAGKATLSLGLLSSVSLGFVGFKLGKEKDWTEGQTTLYQYYGYLVPATTAAILAASGAEDARLYGIGVLASAPIGYYTANRIGNKIDYTRGDLVSITNATVLGFAYGASIVMYAETENRAAILIPTFTALCGSGLAQLNHKDYHITRQQGRRLVWASAGSSLIGMGIAAFAKPDNAGTTVFIPAVTATVGYSVLNNYYKKHPQNELTDSKGIFDNAQFAFHPESILLGKQFEKMNVIPPIMSLSMTF